MKSSQVQKIESGQIEGREESVRAEGREESARAEARDESIGLKVKLGRIKVEMGRIEWPRTKVELGGLGRRSSWVNRNKG